MESLYMKINKSSTLQNTENADELFKAAQIDIEQIYSTIENKRFNHEELVGRICRLATESVEKMLKGWIVTVSPQTKVYGEHDLTKLYTLVYVNNNSFSLLKDNLRYLNNFTPNLRYSSPHNIDEHEVKRCLKELKEVYDFPLIKILRDTINQKMTFIELPEDINELFGKYGSEKHFNSINELRANIVLLNLDNYLNQMNYEEDDLSKRMKNRSDKTANEDLEVLKLTQELYKKTLKFKNEKDLLTLHKSFHTNPKTNISFNLYKYKKARRNIFNNTETLTKNLVETKYSYLCKKKSGENKI